MKWRLLANQILVALRKMSINKLQGNVGITKKFYETFLEGRQKVHQKLEMQNIDAKFVKIFSWMSGKCIPFYFCIRNSFYFYQS